jgi:mono/diheme cytochrome c family protein
MNQVFKLSLIFAVVFGIAISQLPGVQGSETRYSLAQTPEEQEFFEKKIRPILVQNCQKCHNAQARTAGLDLSSAQGFQRGGDSGAIINKDKPEESRLLEVIGYDGTLKMPPTGKLKDDEIAALTAWVKMGAPWPGTTPAAESVKSNAKPSTVRPFTESEKSFWAFQPITEPQLPEVKNTAWIKSPIDRFILQVLEKKNLVPAPPAGKLTLLRRATFDLTGLPPTEAEMSNFLADDSPDAFRKVVDRLLASPRYGERWGRHWLDVARYADSTGNDEDHRYPFAWKYRDYVIQAFNQDLPYDQFIREQLAGDLLPAPDGGEVNRRGIIATGFLALGAKAVAQQDKKKMLFDVQDEQVEVTSKAFLGLTVSCARCHNHKFDPILTKDYYSMLGFFASTRSFTNPDSHVSVVLEKPLVTKTEFESYKAAKKAHSIQETRVRVTLSEIVDAVKEPAARQHAVRTADYFLAARKIYQENIAPADAAKQFGLSEEILSQWSKFLKPGGEVRGYLNEWHNAPAEKLAEVAQSYQQRVQQRLTEWQEKVAHWRREYQKALAENKSLPARPSFEAGEDRLFNDIYFSDGPLNISEKNEKKFSAEQWAQIKKLKQELEALKKSVPAEPEMACAVEDGELVAQKVFIRGDYNNAGEDAPRAFPAILAKFDTRPAFNGSGRLQLAQWIARADHPLTSRVMANRLWQWHFGEGLVRTPDNFGKMGEKPSHPELLDWLAKRFTESGWSIKAMHRMIMLSSAYQMSAVNPQLAPEADNDNRLLTRFNRRRLSVEEMRDALLAIDGTIDLTVGGSLQTGRGTDGENNQGRLSLNPEKLTRRTVYLPLRRANLPTLLNLFDFGDATTMSGKRQLTNVATQALFWMNSDFLTERSSNLTAALFSQQSLSTAMRMESAYQRILNRSPDDREIALSLSYLADFMRKFPSPQAELKAWQSLCRVLMSSNDFVYVD